MRLLFFLLCVGSLSAQSLSIGANVPAVSAGEYGITWRPGLTVELAGVTANYYSDGIFNVGYQFYFKSGYFCSEDRGQSVGIYAWRDNVELSWGNNKDWGRALIYVNVSNQPEIGLPFVVSGGLKLQVNLYSF